MFDSVEDAIAEAQKACAEDPTSGECKVAWEIVEELEAADSHTAGMAPPQELSRAGRVRVGPVEFRHAGAGFGKADGAAQGPDRQIGRIKSEGSVRVKVG